jgi:hypothetical protein
MLKPESHYIVCCLIYGETKEPLHCLLFDLRSDYDFGIFKLFFKKIESKNKNKNEGLVHARNSRLWFPIPEGHQP